jgi:hypothetical protein
MEFYAFSMGCEKKPKIDFYTEEIFLNDLAFYKNTQDH